MRPLIILLALVAVAAAQFNQPRFGSSRFLRFDDDDFDDFFDDDDDDSLEDLYEDLYDDDADDRAEARAALTRLRASGAITGDAFRRNRFVNARSNNRGFNTNRNFNSPRPSFNTGSFNNHRSTIFPTQRPSFNTQRPSSFNAQRPSSFNTQRPSSFNTPRPSSFGTSSSSFGTQGNSFNTPRPAFNSFRSPLPASSIPQKRPFSSSSSTKFLPATSSSLNDISRPSSFRKTSPSPFKSLPSFSWPGGSGYYFSMSTNGAKPVSYFIRYDDD
ncbi:putative protein TPRXL [Eriocheir sinensis]|uniref:putative protein TPRXL n=1 Tax=Eriocheir sinensis TaxID=95602 RepID=UPI0021C89224|nr:putative protein TPRXL [Eriocheir sinensis]